MQSYGCVKCQKRHFEEIDTEFREHLNFQSKHGISNNIVPEIKTLRSSQQIVDQTNELARKFYKMHDRGGVVEKGYRFDEATHPTENLCWLMACEAQSVLTETDVEDCLSDLESE